MSYYQLTIQHLKDKIQHNIDELNSEKSRRDRALEDIKKHKEHLDKIETRIEKLIEENISYQHSLDTLEKL